MEVPPLPIPNREVKLHSADGTAVRWESRSPPTPHNLGSIKQLIGPLSLNMKAVVNAQHQAEKNCKKI